MKATLKIFGTYLLFLFFLLVWGTAFSQITVIHFNADFNKQNNVDWFSDLKECKKQNLLIEKDNNQTKYNIAIVPTIVVYDDGEEVKRFQADISLAIKATIEEVQEVVDDSNMDSW